MKQILIAAESNMLAETLTELLHPSYHIVCAYDGEEALQMLYDLHPDILVLDLMLPLIDGISVLKVADAAGICPRVVALSDFIDDSSVLTLERLKVRAVFRLPMNANIIAAKIMEIAETDGNIGTPEQQIRQLLTVLGFKVAANRCRFIEWALLEYTVNGHRQLFGQLYPEVCARYGGTVSQVEKAIRDCIKNAWQNCNDVIWRMYFTADKNGRAKRPTNAEFFARLSACIYIDEQNIERSVRLNTKIG